MTELAQCDSGNPTAAAAPNRNAVNDSDNSVEQSTSICYGEDAFQNILPQCEVTGIVTTPTGKVLKFRTKYIGFHANNIIMIETPSISASDLSQYICRSYIITACITSSKGSGERVYFKSTIEYLLTGGNTSLILIKLPHAAQVVTGLRENARLDINLPATLFSNPNNYSCNLNNISRTGCLIVIEKGKIHYKVGSVVNLKILDNGDGEGNDDLSVQAVVKNISQTQRYEKVGVRFEDECVDKISALIERLHYCSVEQKFML
ncbi:PilZ domain-containing protein [Vibrio sp. RE86]|uniref:PilZ domain-containing protein n=1 Tax=Vibrio sp. RE86 TaxID=2607605 RepID=UPI0014939209|nr:PilZ domain-containing protein [Vibrio sp. RE86]NOH78424.1 PilZ domain-containing protein [Vibrio sp. RE86]